MNVVASTADFRRAVNIATRVIYQGPSLPILGSVRVHANGSLEVVGTDLDITMAVTVPRQPGPDCTFAMMSPKQVAHAVHVAGGDTVTLTAGEGKVGVASGALSISAATLPVDDFPVHHDRPLEEIFGATLSSTHLAEIARIAGAISTEETRYYLNGILLESLSETKLRATATDGHQLYFVELAVLDAAGTLPEGGVIIPRKAVALMLGLGKDAADGMRLSVGHPPAANDVTSTAPDRKGVPVVAISLNTKGADVRMIAKVIDGTFPDCQRIVPAVSGRQAVLPVAELRRALRAISGHSKHDRAMKLDFTQPDRLVISAAYVSLSLSASVTIPCQHAMRGMVIGFNGGYLSSIIAAAGGDEVVIDVAEESHPAIVRNPADTAWTGLLMPMRI